MVAYGVIKNLNIYVGVPYVSTRSTEPNGGKFAGAKGFQDLGIAVKYQALRKKTSGGELLFGGRMSIEGDETKVVCYFPRKVREIEQSGRMTLIYQHDADRSYVTLIGRAGIAEDRALKRRIWTPGHARWNPGGPDDPATVFIRFAAERIELWSAVHDVMPEPQGYSAAVLERGGEGWRLSET